MGDGRYAGAAYLPAEPLLAWIEAHPDATLDWPTHKNGPKASAARRLREVRRTRRIVFDTADGICCLMGVHMDVVYGDMYQHWALDDSPERLAASKGSTARERKRQKHTQTAPQSVLEAVPSA